MKLIPLSQGLFSMIDDADFEAVSVFKWCAYKDKQRFIAGRGIKKSDGSYTTLLLHRFLMPGVPQIDHMLEFRPFPKMARLSREVIISEKLDGTNAQICIVPSSETNYLLTCLPGQTPEVIPGQMTDPITAVIGGFSIFAGSRNRWITPKDDNYGFAGWVQRNAEELIKLGPGQHFGEWWGAGIQRNYGLKEKRFSLFNASRWMVNPSKGGVMELLPDDGSKSRASRAGPICCSVVPTLYYGDFCTDRIDAVLGALRIMGSTAAPGFMKPEGIVVYHTAAKICFKKTILDDASPKSLI